MAGSDVPAYNRGYRRTLVMALGLAVVGLVALTIAGAPLIGALIAVGLGLGAWNSRRAQESAPRLTAGGVLDKRALSVSGVRRLGFVTFVALVLAFGLRPVGWTAVIGLAAFQLLLIANTARPLLDEVRNG